MLFKLLHEPFRFVCAMEIEENSTKQQDQRLIIFYICGFIEIPFKTKNVITS